MWIRKKRHDLISPDVADTIEDRVPIDDDDVTVTTPEASHSEVGEPTNNDLDDTIPYQTPPGTPSIDNTDNPEDPARVDLPICDEDLGLDQLFEQPQTTRIG